VRVRRRDADEIGLQIAPMCDVVFLVLTFFMLTTHLARQERMAAVRLPTASAAGLADGAEGRLAVTVDAQGNASVGGAALDAAALRQLMRERAKAHPPLKIVLRADAATPARRIREVIGWSAEAGASEVALGTTGDRR